MKRVALKQKTPLKRKPLKIAYLTKSYVPKRKDFEQTKPRKVAFMRTLKRKPLNRYSIKRVYDMIAEIPIRQELCRRAGGEPVSIPHKITYKGISYDIPQIVCLGTCQCGCGERGELHPHEKVFRSHGGKLSLENSIMVLNKHHSKLQNNEPMWSKNNKEAQ